MLEALARRVGYHYCHRLRRETCKRCWRENVVGFSVSDETWRDVVPPRHVSNVLCIACFDRNAQALKHGAPLYVDKAPDLDKLARAVADSLSGVAYLDDRQIAHLNVWKEYGHPARAHIEVRQIDEPSISLRLDLDQKGAAA